MKLIQLLLNNELNNFPISVFFYTSMSLMHFGNYIETNLHMILKGKPYNMAKLQQLAT